MAEQKKIGSRLVVNEGGKKRVYALADQVVSVGRASSNTIPIKDNASSRHHCQVSLQKDGYYVQDLGSRNGTQLNKQTITSQKLAEGDVIQIGKTRIVFLTGPATPSEPNLGQVLEEERRERGVSGKITDRTARPKSEPGASTRRTKPAELDLADEDAPTQRRTPETARTTRRQIAPPAESDGELRVADDEEDTEQRLPGLEEPYYLVRFRGADEEPFRIRQVLTSIGRLDSNTISLEGEESVSGRHAELRLDDGVFSIKDLGSTNGTRVNGILMKQPHSLKAGDLVELGRVQFLFKSESFARSAGTAAAAEDQDGADGAGLPLPLAPAASGAPGILLPMVTTLGGIVVLVGGLTFWSLRSSQLPPPEVPEVPGNLVSEYSFETVRGSQPAGWTLGGKGIAVKEVNDAPSGKRVLVIGQPDAKAPLPILAAIYDRTIKVARQSPYRVEAQVRHAQGAGYAALRLRWLSSTDPYFAVDDHAGMLQAAAGWKKVSATYQAPPGADRVQVACLVIGPVEGAQFDAVQLFEAGGAPEPPPALAGVALDRSGLVAVTREQGETVFSRGRLLVLDEKEQVLYDQTLLQRSGNPRKDGESLAFEGKLPHLRGGPPLPLKLAIRRDAQGLVFEYKLESEKPPGATVRFRADVEELDAASAMAVESQGQFETIRGAFVKPETTLFTWKGRERHLGLYPASPSFVRYAKEPRLEVDLFQKARASHALEFRLRLSFEEDQAALKKSIDLAFAAKEAGKVGEAYKQFQEIVRTYPFIETSNQARQALERIEKQAADDLAALAQELERARYFGRSSLLVTLRERTAAFQTQYAGMAAAAAAEELARKVTDDLATTLARENEEDAAALLQRAEDFLESGMKGLAATFFRRIVEKYPKAPQAPKAAEALKALEEK